MGDDTGELAPVGDDDAVRAGRAAAVDLAGLEHGELIVGTRDAIESETLVVVVPVRIRRRTSLTTVPDVAAGSISSGLDSRAAVLDASASGARGPVLEIRGGGGDQGHEGEQADNGELHVGGWKECPSRCDQNGARERIRRKKYVRKYGDK